MIGHTMGAASAIEAVTCALVVSRNVVPPTIHLETKDPDCDLNYVPNVKKEAEIDIAMNNAFAFGGENTSLILAKYTGRRKS
jgi:3-oxoacyl-[acyl-carrier-protein] synthase II